VKSGAEAQVRPSSDPQVEIREMKEGESLKQFIRVAWHVNSSDPAWVPPLFLTVKTLLDRRRHPFHRHADVAYFLAMRNGSPVGRIAAIVNHRHNEFHRERTGFFGMFECEDDPEVAIGLFDQAASWLRERGVERMRGPVNLSTNHDCGLLVEGFDRRPVVMMPHNPAYYPQLFRMAGLAKSRDLLAYWIDSQEPPERLVAGADKIASRLGVSIRTIEMRRFPAEVALIREIYNAAWSRNWGFVPMTEAEFGFMARELKLIVDPDLCLIAEVRGEPVGFSLALPDINQALRRAPDGRLLPFGIFRVLAEMRRLKGFRIVILGLKPGFQQQGLGACLYLRTWRSGASKGYRYAEASWILEDNWKMRRPLESMGAVPYKRYRIYERPL
jgi:GNAT superfamily N-acetyltransferase